MAEKSNNLFHDDLDEIVFADRNKEYGAYAMRRAYSKMVNRSVMIGIVILLLTVLIPFFIWQQTSKANENKDISMEMMNQPLENKDEAPPPPPPPPDQAIEEKAKFTAPVVVTDTNETTDLNQDDLNQQTVNTNINTDDDMVIDDDDDNNVIEEVVETPIFTVVEEMPSFPGGDESRIKFLTENIKYPQMAKESGIQGTVFVTFVVNENGLVTDVKVLRGIGGGCDEEAVRVVKMMPKWNSGKQSGKSVRVQFNMPIRFTLN